MPLLYPQVLTHPPRWRRATLTGTAKLDLAVAMTGDMVFILLGDGTGKFALASSPACGGSAGTSGPPPLTGTPAGTYTLSVAASGSGLTNNTSLTLVVN